MEQNINLGIMLVLILLEIVLYFILLGSLIPKILRIHCSLKTSTDRGLKKYSYPGGRGILYEPHPSIRKYINSYVLFTNEGYKYLKCKLDVEVTKLKYTVVMFNRHSRVIDVIGAHEISPLNGETTELLLHQDTSYVSLVLESVNGIPLKHENVVCCKLWRLFLYSLSVSVITFAQLMFVKEIFTVYDTSWIKSGFAQAVSINTLIRPSILVGIAVGLLVFIYHRAKRVRWTR